ncbi:hypothetical protein [Paenibacillus nasutitermitis]|uniref:Uncharacterized protein n=1 Tax=Paenibacillus nasutitermitis TaxID=1652958 RepID=A0A917DQF8_9BACL|nr:hypothetical protein [Paenibacillus nasutitermitis]GGD61000.1 hypothetical protein GCM10010911_18590 [Paenibacillus nasutitermitis]
MSAGYARNSWYTWRRSAIIRKITLVGLQSAGGRTESAEESYMRSLMTDELCFVTKQERGERI